MAKHKHFGTDGIRGLVGTAPLTADFALHLANAVAQRLQQDQPKPRVVIGADTRISCPMLEAAMSAGFNAAGVDVLCAGVVPTPAVAYLTRSQKADLGVVISASHNPFGDNGIKFFSAQGSKLSDAWQHEVEQLLDAPMQHKAAANLGKTTQLNDAAAQYMQFCLDGCDANLRLEGLKIVLDAAHGAAYAIAPKVLQKLGAEVVAIGCAPNGININDGVGATHPKNLVAAVQQHQADYGIALDGDADRLQMVDFTGRIFNGDELLYLLAQDRRAQGQKIHGIVGTLMTNLAVEAACSQQNIELVRADVGDRYVMEQLQAKNWLLGGESSGHILVLDKHSTGDGIISALQVLQAVVRNQNSMAEMLKGIALYEQKMINVRIQKGMDWQQNTAMQQAITAAEQALGKTGRVLIRASGTEPVLRVMVEAQDAQKAQQWAENIAAEVPSC